jgi:predicted XRE-type DNA-binding protein
MQTKTRQKRTAKSVVPKPRPSPRRSGQPIATSKGIAHITLAGGNVFADPGFSESEAANLKVRAQLMRKLRDVIVELTQVEAANLLGVAQPRVSDLKRGKIGLFTIDSLVNMLACAGITVRVSLSRSKDTAA